MSRSRRYIAAFLTVLLLVLMGQDAAAFPDGWDKALDQYEAICKRCLELRARSFQGEQIPADTLKELLAELASLRRSLQNGSGSMTAEQRIRFEQIRQYYLFSTTDDRGGRQIFPEAETVSGVLAASAPEEPQPPIVVTPVPKIRRWHWGLVPTIGIPVRKALSARDLSVGMTLLSLDGKTGLGIYLKGLTTFRYPSVIGTCFRDGTLPGGGYFYSSGNSAYSAFTVTGGMLYRFHRNIGVWAGVGYASETVCWQGADKAWYRVEDASGRGVCPEAGVVLTLGDFGCGSLTFLAGGRFSLPKKASVDIGLGWLF